MAEALFLRVARPAGLARATLLGQPIGRALVVVDFLAIAGGLLLALAAESWLFGPTPSTAAQQFVVVALPALLLLVLWLRQTRRTTVLGAGLDEYRRVLTSCWIASAATAGLAYVLVGAEPRRRTLVLASFFGMLAILAGRWSCRKVLIRVVQAGRPLSRVLVVALGAHSEAIREEISMSDGRLEVVGSVGDERGPPEPRDVVARALECDADTIVIGSIAHQDPTWTRRLGWALEDSDLELMVSPAITAVAGPRLTVESVQDLTLVRIEPPRFSGPTRVVKRVVDLIGSAAGLLLLLVPLLAVAALIRADSAGPVFFRQRRAGREGIPFVCWKFRTMVVGADRQRASLRESAGSDGAIFKMEADPRVTRIGRFLRRTSIDELPQLVNVLMGQMSLVGPRPHPLDDVERYDGAATRRLLVKPGMTGLWQVSGRSDLDWEKSVTLDLRYVENWSLALDATILLKTAAAVARGSGAY